MSIAGQRLTLVTTLRFAQKRLAVDEKGKSSLPIAKFALF